MEIFEKLQKQKKTVHCSILPVVGYRSSLWPRYYTIWFKTYILKPFKLLLGKKLLISQGPDFGCQGSLFGTHFIESWVPIGFLLSGWYWCPNIKQNIFVTGCSEHWFWRKMHLSVRALLLDLQFGSSVITMSKSQMRSAKNFFSLKMVKVETLHYPQGKINILIKGRGKVCCLTYP